MSRNARLCLLAALALAIAAPASGGTTSKRKHIKQKIHQLEGKVHRARKQKAVLTSQISRITGRIRYLQGQIGTQTVTLDKLQAELAKHERILSRLNIVYNRETSLLTAYRGEYSRSEQALEQRLVSIYKQGEPDTMAVVLSSRSIGTMIDDLTFARSITRLDHDVTTTVRRDRDRMQVLQSATQRNRVRIITETKTVADAAWHARTTRDALSKHRFELKHANQRKHVALSVVTESEQEYLNEISGLQAASARLEGRLRSSASHGSGVSSSGLIWPVNGPITSPFGWRWGRMHEGVDIGVGYGTPIAAAASGTVVYAGWESGYGNFVVIDHGNGLATAYGHQSRIAVSNGQAVTQGETIGYVGCTGHCFGPHLHFEVRVNGSAVDPLGYL